MTSPTEEPTPLNDDLPPFGEGEEFTPVYIVGGVFFGVTLAILGGFYCLQSCSSSPQYTTQPELF
jgi:hypothetical protein